MKQCLMALVAFTALAGCQNGITPGNLYITADRQTKTALEPVVQKATQADPALKPSVDDVMTSWELRLQQAEQANK